MKNPRKWMFFIILSCILFNNSVFAIDLQLVLNNQTLNPLDFLIPTVDSDNELCRTHSLLYKEELSKFTVWATDMFDATTKFPSGIFFGSNVDTGNFDECINVHLPENVGFSGQHCMAHFKVKPLNPVVVEKGNPLEYDKYENIFNITTWHKIAKYAQDISKQSRDEVDFTFCIPSTCSYSDLRKVLQTRIKLFKHFLPVTLEVDVDPKKCQVDRGFEFTKSDKIFMGIVGGFVLFGVTCTIYHLFTRLEELKFLKLPGKTHQILRAFSFSHTIKKMASTSENEDGMECMHGMKVLSMFLIIMGHRVMFSISSPVGNPVFVENIYRKVEFCFLLNGPIIVDTFFTISGFLASYLILKEIKKRKRMVNVIMVYLHRFIRLTPSYAVVLGFYCTIFVQMGDGPFWKERIGVEQERCLETWWANILYINNYYEIDKLCMFQSWYLTCDTHYFLLVPFLAYLLWKKPRIGLTVCTGLIFIFLIIPFMVIYINREEPFLLLFMRTLRDPVTNPTFQLLYIPSHMRASPYFIGVLFGYWKFKIVENNIKLPKSFTYPTWVIGYVVAFAIFFTAFLFYIPTGNKNYFLSALFGSVHHVLWSVCIGLLIIFISEGYGPWFAPYLNWKPWALLSRITYTAYLCHGAIQLYTAGITRYPVYAGMFNLVNYTSSDLVLAYLAGFCLSLVFESPILELEKIIFGRQLKKKNSVIVSEKLRNEKKNMGEIYIPKISTIYR